MVKNRMSLHIQMKYHNQVIPTTLKDPKKIHKEMGNKSIQEIILGWTCPDKGPLFRHLSRKWSWDPDVIQWGIYVHQHMYAVAFVKAQSMKAELVKQFGTALENKFFAEIENATYASTAGSNVIFDLDDANNDMYMSGKTSFSFAGLPQKTMDHQKTIEAMKEATDTSIAFSESENTQPPQIQGNNRQQSQRSQTPRTQETSSRSVA